MRIDKNLYPDAADRYLKRFKERGLKMAPKARLSDRHDYGVAEFLRNNDHAYKSKPNHAARTQKIDDVFPPLASLFAPKDHDHGQADRQ